MTSLRVGGTRISYYVEGPAEGPAMVFVNSLGTDHRLWDGQVEPMLARGMRVVRYDFAGHGDSDAPSAPVSIATFGQYLLELLAHLGIPRAHLCGCSLGGMVAQWIAAAHPDLVTAIVLANTGVQIGTVENWNARIDAVQVGGMAAIRDSILSRFFSQSFRDRSPSVVARIGAMIDATNPRGYVAACAAVRDADLRTSSSSLSTPTLVIAGALDPATPPSKSEELRDIIQGSELVIVPGAAHLTNVEQDVAFNDAVLSFLDRTSASSNTA